MAVRPANFGSLPQKSYCTKQYNRFRGVDFSTDPALVDASRSPMAMNLISDSGGYPEKRVGWETLCTLDAPVNGMYYLVDKDARRIKAYHCRNSLYSSCVRVTNLLGNGDFSGTLGWTGSGATLAAANNTLYISGSGAAANPSAAYTVEGGSVSGHSVYGKVRFRVTGGGSGTGRCLRAGLTVSPAAEASPAEASVAEPVDGMWYDMELSGVFAQSGSGSLAFRVFHEYENAADTLGRAMECQCAVAVDLTPAFSDGRDLPTSAQFNAMLLEHSASRWFAGTADIDATPGRPLHVADCLADARSTGFTHGGRLYILDGSDYWVYDGATVASVVNHADTFIPTTVIGRAPTGGGTPLEAVNLVNSKRKNSFIGNGTATVYKLDSKDVDPSNIRVFINNSEISSGFTLNATEGTVTFTTAPANGNGVDNVVITFSKTVMEPDGSTPAADRIRKCRINTWYGMGNDSRCFVAGNPKFQNMDWQSGLYDPTYFPDTGYTKVGADSSAIMGYLRQYENLLIVKADNEQDATVYMRTAEYDAEGRAVFPLKQGVAGIGAVSMHAFARLRDDPLFLAKEGVFTPTLAYGSVDQQRSTQNCSHLVDARLTREPGLENAVSAVWNDWFLLCLNGNCYVADGKQKTGKSADEGFGYEWFFWTNIPARVFLEVGGTLFFGTADGRICRFKSHRAGNREFSDDGAAIEAYWESKLDDDGDFMRLKELPRRGSGVLVKPYSKSSVDVLVNTDSEYGRKLTSREVDSWDWDNIDFERFSFKANDTPFVIPLNARIKQYQSIQLILRNAMPNEGFGCYGIIRRFVVKGYVR